MEKLLVNLVEQQKQRIILRNGVHQEKEHIVELIKN